LSLCQVWILGWNHFVFMWIVCTFMELFSFTLVRLNCVWKLCFDSHMDCCGSCMLSTIGVGAGKFLGLRRILPEFSQTCPKSFGRLCLQFFPSKIMKTFLGWPPKKVFVCLSANVGRHFMKSNKVARLFSRIFKDFAQIFKDFARIFNKCKILGVRLHPASYTAG